MTNMTYVNAIDFAIENLDNAEVVEKLSALKESLIKRNSKKSNSMTKTQKENVEIKERIVEVLSESDGLTATDVALTLGVSVAKATALLTQLVKAEVVKRNKDKKVVTFSI